jgi:hypothetical protein
MHAVASVKGLVMSDLRTHLLLSESAPKFLTSYLDAVDGATFEDGYIPEVGTGYLVCALWRGTEKVGQIALLFDAFGDIRLF